MISAALLVVAPVVSSELVLFADGDLSGWKKHSFTDKIKPTEYEIVDMAGAPGSGKVLEAVAQGGASGYIMKRPIEFSPSTKLKVVYKVLAADNQVDEQSKEGDDFPLRIYLTNLSMLGGNTLVLAHTLQTPIGGDWPSPYESALAKFQIFSIENSPADPERWIEVDVPVGQLWQRAFGDHPSALDGVSFMVDSDNTNGNFHTQIDSIIYTP